MMLKDFQPRLYQQTILGTAANFNTLVVLPTGLGKTALAFLLTAQRLFQYPHSKILLLAPTKPLCEQHQLTFQKYLEIPAEKVVLFTGEVSPEKRAKLWQEAQIIISTPQGLENDLINKRAKFEDVSLLVLDEAHHATGDYAYVWLAQQYEKLAKYPRILALTASPGSDLDKIKEVCKNLKIEKVEVRTEKDSDVQQYIQPTKINWQKVDFPPEYKKVQLQLQECRKAKLLEMQKLGYLDRITVNKTELLILQGEFQKKISGGEHDFEILRSVSLLAEALKVDHALELLETQGIQPLHKYLQKMQEEAPSSKVKALKNLMLDQNFKAAMFLTQELAQEQKLHPKLQRLSEMVQADLQENPTNKIIIFTQFRDSAEEILKEIDRLKLKNHLFFGQAKKNGLGYSQKQQKEILDQFRSGEFNVLIATSVAEEGLDIPKVDQVIFYEPIPSAIRSIQRRGRTGRLEKGEVIIFYTAGTRDEAYKWSAHHKEKRMYQNLEELKKKLILEPPEHQTLEKFIPENQVVAVLADHREKDNKVVKELIEMGVSVKTAQLQSADYLLSGDVGVELKKVPDFVASILDGRLLEQVRELRKNFEKALLIIEGEEDIYSIRKVHANAIRGMLASIVLDFHIPVLYTKNPQDTAGLLAVMAKREQDKDAQQALSEHKPRSLAEQQEYFLASLPGLGLNTAKLLLQKFGSIQETVNSSVEQLQEIKGVGPKTAQKLIKLFTEKYSK